MSTRDIEAYVEELYGIEVSPTPISAGFPEAITTIFPECVVQTCIALASALRSFHDANCIE